MSRDVLVHVIGSLATGGAERVLERLITSSTNDWEHHVLVLRPGGAIGQRLQAAGIPVRTIAESRRRLLASPWLISRYAASVNAAIVHGWMYHANALVSMASLGQQWKVVWGIRTVSQPTRERWRTRAAMALCNVLASLPNLIVYNSVAAKLSHERQGYPTNRGLVVHNGYDLTRLRPEPHLGREWRDRHMIPSGTRLLVVPARLHPVKGHVTLLHAIAAAGTALANTVVVAVGREDGVSPQELLSEAESLGLRGVLRVFPEEEDVAPCLNAADVVVLPSLWGESMPNAVLEALACGKPVVASDLGDTRELVGPAGECPPPGNTQALAASLVEFAALSDQELVAIGSAGREIVEQRFTITHMTRAYNKALAGTLERRDA